jgi:hypothetical protein
MWLPNLRWCDCEKISIDLFVKEWLPDDSFTYIIETCRGHKDIRSMWYDALSHAKAVGLYETSATVCQSYRTAVRFSHPPRRRHIATFCVAVSLVRSQMRHLCRCAVMRFVSGLSVWVSNEQFGAVNEGERKPLNPSGHYMYRQFNIQQFYILPTQCIYTYVFCVDLRTDSDYFPIQH